jgi:hypothetical protein
MRFRWLAVVGIAGILLMLVVVMRTRKDDPAAGNAAAPASPPKAMHATSRSADTSPASASALPFDALPADQRQAVRARSQAMIQAVSQLQLEAMPRLDNCLGPVSGPRAPRAVIVTFKRDADAGGGLTRYVVTNVQPASSAGREPAADSDVGRCLHELERLPLMLSSEHAPETKEFQQVLILLLPASGAP